MPPLRSRTLWTATLTLCALSLPCSCTKMEQYWVDVPHEVTKYRTVRYDETVPYEVTETYEVRGTEDYEAPVLRDRYEVGEPLFSDVQHQLCMTVMPFTVSEPLSAQAGLDIAEEIEHRLSKLMEAYNEQDLPVLTKQAQDSLASYGGTIDEEALCDWVERNRERLPSYQIINRTQIDRLPAETRLDEEGQPDASEVARAHDIIRLDGLVHGHLSRKSNGTVSFILKILDAQSSRVLFTERFEGSREAALNKAVDSFFFGFVQGGDEKLEVGRETRTRPIVRERQRQVTRYRIEKRTRQEPYRATVMRREQRERKVVNWEGTFLVVCSAACIVAL